MCGWRHFILPCGGIVRRFPGGRRVRNLKRNRQGGGDLGYEFLVDGLEEQEVLASVLVPEQKLSKEQLEASLPKIMETLCGGNKGREPIAFGGPL